MCSNNSFNKLSFTTEFVHRHLSVYTVGETVGQVDGQWAERNSVRGFDSHLSPLLYQTVNDRYSPIGSYAMRCANCNRITFTGCIKCEPFEDIFARNPTVAQRLSDIIEAQFQGESVCSLSLPCPPSASSTQSL